MGHPARHDRFLHRRHELLGLALDSDGKHPNPCDLPLPEPSATPARTEMKQSGTSKQCSAAIDQALTGIREQITAASGA